MPLNQIFYAVHRLFIKGENVARSVELFNDSWEAEKRFYAIIAADVANDEIVYNECFVRDNFGRIVNGLDKVFDRRDFSEPEPEPTPEPVAEPEPEPENEPEEPAEDPEE